MMPPGHVAVTWGITGLLQKNNPQLAQLDYRLLAACALLPDIIDKPLAMLVFTRAETSQFIAHSLIFNLVLIVLALLFWKRSVPYVLAVTLHLLADRMWHHGQTFWWPVYGWNVFWAFKPMNTPETMVSVYLDLFIRYPQVWVIETLAMFALGWFVFSRRLYQWPNLKHFLVTGQIKWGKQNTRPEASGSKWP
ncbi:MAG: metal-dependent hydrolase [Anaerolineae bacterium]|nr:metal-dependent hydrolase [Anaerolineae bacterium]